MIWLSFLEKNLYNTLLWARQTELNGSDKKLVRSPGDAGEHVGLDLLNSKKSCFPFFTDKKPWYRKFDNKFEPARWINYLPSLKPVFPLKTGSETGNELRLLRVHEDTNSLRSFCEIILAIKHLIWPITWPSRCSMIFTLILYKLYVIFNATTWSDEFYINSVWPAQQSV